jgi:hypothetical protein
VVGLSFSFLDFTSGVVMMFRFTIYECPSDFYWQVGAFAGIKKVFYDVKNVEIY